MGRGMGCVGLFGGALVAGSWLVERVVRWAASAKGGGTHRVAGFVVFNIGCLGVGYAGNDCCVSGPFGVHCVINHEPQRM